MLILHERSGPRSVSELYLLRVIYFDVTNDALRAQEGKKRTRRHQLPLIDAIRKEEIKQEHLAEAHLLLAYLQLRRDFRFEFISVLLSFQKLWSVDTVL